MITLRDALAPLASRMPRVVREHEILRVAASLVGHGPAAAAAEARHEVLKWVQKRSGGQLPPEAWDGQSFDYLSGGRNSAGARIAADASDIWAIRADDPDKTVPGRIWTTEVVVGLSGDSPARFSLRLMASTGEESFGIEPHTPGLVQQVAETCGLIRGRYEVTATPWLIETDGDAGALLDMLNDPQRSSPVFVLTVPEAAA